MSIGEIGKTIKGFFWPEAVTPTEVEESLKREAEGLETKANHLENVAVYQERITKAKERIKATGSGQIWYSKKFLVGIGAIVIFVILMARSC